MSSDNSPTLDMKASNPDRLVLVTGATGYVGGRLITELLAAGFRVRASSRRISSMQRFDWSDDVELVEADLAHEGDAERILEGVDVAMYLVHSMGGKDEDFEVVEQRTATSFARAAEAADVKQIVYLSGLHPSHKKLDELSKHMRSRERVAQIFLESDIPTLVYRAATLIGSGSASFEMIRHLTERLPIMVAPSWIVNRIEPLSIRDTLYYLVQAADLDEPVNRGYDIGCGKVYKFMDLLKLYGKQRGLKRYIFPVPLQLPMDLLSGGWIGLVTPVPASLAIPLAQSMAEDAITEEHDIEQIIPDPPEGLIDYSHAVQLALKAEEERGVPTSWDNSWSSAGDAADSLPTDPQWSGSTVYEDTRHGHSDLPPEKIWEVVEGIGGSHGWYSTPVLWRIRGLVDRLIGGPGLRSRRDPWHLKPGDRVDWWRVAEIDAPHRLVLAAEMKLDGRGWLILEVEETDTGSRYTQRAIFQPTGLPGRLYWWSLIPFHSLIFPLMLRNILKKAEELNA
ncbi:SDR family oxidoreductase [Corynebacterium sp. ES2730-CONJ]|uniref:SDR family oxidoreductase n=1 Tax=Corynebacterium sp. ES2730-CONJ TaxID=2973941 RepID=UPI00216AF9A5|nr:SDR family oxidoreductase [Corynebacterium sp. ES2730-CONJ]MCS4530922.1 SDR family oxidoreductase [Corynebacterium sp. ES2730-CONJ]